MPIDVELSWRPVMTEDPAWTWSLALYAIAAAGSREIIYLGKADGSTLRQRWRRDGAKEKFRRWYERVFRTETHLLFVGEFVMSTARLTRQLVADIESLLIHRLKPLGNIGAIRTRISRPRLRVSCTGEWPEAHRLFVDGGY